MGINLNEIFTKTDQKRLELCEKCTRPTREQLYDEKKKQGALQDRINKANQILESYRNRIKGQSEQINILQVSVEIKNIKLNSTNMNLDFIKARIKNLFGDNALKMIYNTIEAPINKTNEEILSIAKQRVAVIKKSDIKKEREKRIVGEHERKHGELVQ